MPFVAAIHFQFNEVNWDTLVAVGTLLLAAVTALLAKSTRDLADETKQAIADSKLQLAESQKLTQATLVQVEQGADSLEIARNTLSAEIRPVLVGVEVIRPADELGALFRSDARQHREPVFFPNCDSAVDAFPADQVIAKTRPDGAYFVSAPVRNIGRGVAVVTKARIVLNMAWDAPVLVPAHIAPSEEGRLSFHGIPGQAVTAPMNQTIEAKKPFALMVAYTDLADDQLTATMLYVQHIGVERGWIMRRVELLTDGSALEVIHE